MLIIQIDAYIAFLVECKYIDPTMQTKNTKNIAQK